MDGDDGDTEPELLFDPDLFIDKEYVETKYEFEGAETVRCMALAGSSTDFDLTGQIVWPAARLLGHYTIANREQFENKRVLELGAGCGLCGLLIAQFAHSLVLSDHQRIVLELLRQNVDLLPPSAKAARCVTCELLEWRDPAPFVAKYPGKFNLVVGADVVHWPESITPLVNTVEATLEKSADARAIICYLTRSEWTAKEWNAAIAASRLVPTMKEIPVTGAGNATEWAAGEPHIMELRWKPEALG